jgi:hypothetical protein
MRSSYKRKLRAERALVKAFGLEHRSLAYNDTINGYVNAAFDSNSLLPIPGTNLYAYEGSNPVWLKKYDKLENKASHQLSSTSGTSSSSASSTNGAASEQSAGNHTNNNNNNINNNSIVRHGKHHNLQQQQQHQDDISSFYLKQIDSSPPTSKCSPSSYSNDKGSNNNVNKTMSSDVYSIQDAYSNTSGGHNHHHHHHQHSPVKKSQVVLMVDEVDNVPSTATTQLSSFKAAAESTTAATASSALLTFLKTNTPATASVTSTSNVHIVSINHHHTTPPPPPPPLSQFQSKTGEIVSFRTAPQPKRSSESSSPSHTAAVVVSGSKTPGGVVITDPLKKLSPTALNNKYTKIFDSIAVNKLAAVGGGKHNGVGGSQDGGRSSQQLTQKEFCDLFEVESTVI